MMRRCNDCIIMFSDETFHRVPEIHKSSRSSSHGAARGNKETRSGIPKTGRRESSQARPQAWLKKKAESRYAFRFRPRGKRNLLEGSFRFFVLLRRQFRIRQSLSDNLRTQQTETISISDLAASVIFAVIEPESLFIHISEQMERLNGDICPAKATLQKRPEIFYSLNMNLP